MKNSARTIGVALLAAAAGAGVALLLAPYSGERTRRLIRFKAESFAKDLRDEVNATLQLSMEPERRARNGR
jgi:gas vesicle protein